VNWIDYVFIYLVVNLSVVTSMLFFRIYDNYVRFKKAKETIEMLREQIESELEFRNIVSKIDLDGNLND
jgi:hypothetical protein